MGEVFSRNEAFMGFGPQVWGYAVFHAVTMGLGMFFIGLAVSRKGAAAAPDDGQPG